VVNKVKTESKWNKK